MQWGVCRRPRAVLSSGGPLLSVGCRRFWQGGPLVFFRGPRGCRLQCRLPGRFACILWSGWAGWAASWLCACLVPPPLVFFTLFFSGGGVCLFLPLPSLAWCTHWSAFGLVNQVAVGAGSLLGRAPAPLVGWVMSKKKSLPCLSWRA